jgi:hypothetical protein
MYIHGASVYFIHPDAPFSQKYKDDLLTPTAYSKKLALSNFTGLATASVVHMNKRSLLWLNGTNLYSGGPAYDTGSGASTLVSSNITEAKSFGPFLFVKNNSGKVFFVAETGQNKIVEIVGATDLSFLSDKTKAYMVSGDTIQLVGIGSTNNYNFKYTDISISSGSVVAVVASDTTVAGNGYQTAYNSTYTSGSNTYSGPNMPGAWVVDSTGNLAHTNDVFGTPENGVPRAWEFSCIDTPTWSASMTNNNDINSVYAGTNAVAASYLGGYGNLSVGMMSDGTLKFAGSNSSGRVIGGHRQTSTKLINGYGWPYTNQSLGFCNPTELPVDSIPGPNNVVASKAAFNNKVNVTWDAKSAGTVYSVRRIGTGVDQVVATALADTTFEDVSVTKGANKSEAISYAVSANSASGIYQTRTGSPYYYPSSAWSGCNASSALSDNCVGFRANAPTGATNNSVDVTAGVSQQVISTTGINVTDIDSPYDTFVFSLASQPTLGSVSVNGSGQFLYTPNSGFLGVDSFNTVVTDKAGNTKNVPIQVNVLCPAPTISTITFPVSYDAFVAQLGSVQYTASACSETG